MPEQTLEEFIKSIAIYRGSPEIGCKYWETRSLGVAEVAKLIRADIKEKVGNGALPDHKYSVTIQRYAGGQSIDIRTTRKPQKAGARAIDPASVNLILNYILDTYNFDASSGMHDYSCVRFRSSVSLHKPW